MSTKKECGVQRCQYVEPQNNVGTWLWKRLKSSNGATSEGGDITNIVAHVMYCKVPYNNFGNCSGGIEMH